MPNAGKIVRSLFYNSCLVAKPFNRSEARGDLAVKQTLPLFKCKLLYILKFSRQPGGQSDMVDATLEVTIHRTTEVYQTEREIRQEILSFAQ